MQKEEIKQEDNIVSFSNSNLSIVSHTHRNVILNFNPSLMWLAVIAVEVLNRLDSRNKPLGINNFYIDGIEHETFN